MMLRRTIALSAPAITTLITAALTGCAVGPDYTPPEVRTPGHFVTPTTASSGRNTVAPTPAVVDAAWWRTLGDPQLTDLIESAVAANPDVAAARAKVREARALHAAAAAGLVPHAEASGGYERERLSRHEPGAVSQLADRGLIGLNQELYDIGFDAGWEIDIFGGTRRAAEAAQARAQAAAESARAVTLSLAAEVARNYIELRAAQQRVAVLEDQASIEQRQLDLTRDRLAHGYASKQDVAQAEAQHEQAAAAVPLAEAEVHAAAYRLSVLTGSDDPAVMLEQLAKPQPIPGSPAMVPVGLPSDLLRRRPDLRQAERELHASVADIGAATADLYPRFFLTGGASLRSGDFADLFEKSSGAWSIGPTVTWPIFEAGRISDHIDATKARRDAALARYQQAVRSAVGEVDTDLTRYAHAQLQRRRFAKAVAAQRDAVAMAQAAQQRGQLSTLDVLSARRQLDALEIQLTASRANTTLSVIALYKSLGGGWQAFEPDPRLTEAGVPSTE